MNLRQRKAFIRELIASVENEILGNAERFPERWDGHELRRYIADTFDEKTGGLCAHGGRGDPRRRREYENDVIVNNL